jgi:hypothetical protein
MNIQPFSTSASIDAGYPRKWKIGGVLSSDISPALLSLTVRSRIKRFPLRPAVTAAELPVRLLDA